MIHRLAVCALGLACALAVLFLVAFESRSADFDKDWLLEDLTCEELVSGYTYGVIMLNEIISIYNECQVYADSPADEGHGALHCALIRKEGKFVQGMVNDIADVFNARCGK